MRFDVTKTSFDPAQSQRAVGMLDPTSDNRSKQDLGYVGDRREALSVTPNWRKDQPKHRGNDKWPSDFLDFKTRYLGMQPRKVTLSGSTLTMCKMTKDGRRTKSCQLVQSALRLHAETVAATLMLASPK
eukprot:jgi/Undpi1/13521/HiC_scaffold_8.g03180.m1